MNFSADPHIRSVLIFGLGWHTMKLTNYHNYFTMNHHITIKINVESNLGNFWYFTLLFYTLFNQFFWVKFSSSLYDIQWNKCTNEWKLWSESIENDALNSSDLHEDICTAEQLI